MGNHGELLRGLIESWTRRLEEEECKLMMKRTERIIQKKFPQLSPEGNPPANSELERTMTNQISSAAGKGKGNLTKLKRKTAETSSL